MQGLGVEPRPWPNGQSISCPAAVDDAAVVAVDAAFAAASAAAAADVAAVAVMDDMKAITSWRDLDFTDEDWL